MGRDDQHKKYCDLFGERLKRWRKSNGMSRADAAIFLGVSVPWLFRIENKHSNAAFETVCHVASKTGTSLDLLVHEKVQEDKRIKRNREHDEDMSKRIKFI